MRTPALDAHPQRAFRLPLRERERYEVHVGVAAREAFFLGGGGVNIEVAPSSSSSSSSSDGTGGVGKEWPRGRDKRAGRCSAGARSAVTGTN